MSALYPFEMQSYVTVQFFQRSRVLVLNFCLPVTLEYMSVHFFYGSLKLAHFGGTTLVVSSRRCCSSVSLSLVSGSACWCTTFGLGWGSGSRGISCRAHDFCNSTFVNFLVKLFPDGFFSVTCRFVTLVMTPTCPFSLAL